MVSSSVIEGYVHNPKQQEHTAAFKIWKYLFLCEVAEMHLMSQEFIEKAGLVTTHDPELDRSMALQPRQCQLTIAGMTQFHSEGISFNLVNPEDSIRIYQIIFDHLTDWSNAVRDNVNVLEAPVDELRMLDDLAAEVYKLARFYWKDNPYHGRLEHFLHQKTRNRIRRHTKLTLKTDNPVEHTPMADAIREELKNRNKPWKGG